MRVGVAGVGRMGAAIALRLMETGHALTVWNRSSDKTKPLANIGAHVAKSPAELASSVEAIVTILTNGTAMTDVYEGASGLLAGDVRGKLVIEMSTVQPHEEVALAEKARARGVVFVECPVGGTVSPARQGKLLGVAGGTKEDFAQAKPLLEQMCRRVEHVGPVGAGSSMKLALNLPLMVYYQALGESLLLCRHLGLDNKWLMEFLSDTSGAPNMLKTRGPAIASALDGKDIGAANFDVDLICKDLRAMLAEAGKHGATLPVVQQALSIYEQAVADGWGRRDGACLPAYWGTRSGP
jgi:3-hydroxyisobutyrate dehydrogenase